MRRTNTEEPMIDQPTPMPEMSAADRIRATKPPRRSRASNAWTAFGQWLLELTDRLDARKRQERSGR